ncbi:alpha/beta fold hydrolase [Hyalangium sp.]|uniref:alpha/beta fold hydrolase n=1 Tax=Hyalangium sp. TaxID=2028555 RepID=UPI002D74EE32|nr:alpha/beta fold hydrolase [Hyalangium sp.]HYH97420.1 alpha/beta fold hydrolase [Hyalangium sp.]
METLTLTAPAASGTSAALSAPSWVDTESYPFAHRSVELPDGRMHYVEEGRGPLVLFVHGTPTWSFEWRHLIRGLSSSHRCIAPDLLGFGLSERPERFEYTPEAHARALATFVERLGLKDFTLVVHDFGGPIGLPLALEQPERIRELVLFNTWMWSFAEDREMVQRGKIVSGALGGFLYRRLNFSLRVLAPSAYGDRRKLTRRIHRQYLAPFPDAKSRGQVLWALARALNGSSAFYASQWERRQRLQGRPALILWGMKDTAFRPHMLGRWKEALPDARVVELADAGHWPHEESPEAVLRELRAFLSS